MFKSKSGKKEKKGMFASSSSSAKAPKPAAAGTKVFQREASAASSAAFVAMVDVIRKRGLKRPGIFRVSGDAEAVADAVESLDNGESPRTVLSALGAVVGNADSLVDSVASLLKKWTRSRSLLTSDQRNAIIGAVASGDPTKPIDKRSDFWTLLELLADVADHKATNKMDSYNLAVVFAPNLSDDAIFGGVEAFVDTLSHVINAVHRARHPPKTAETPPPAAPKAVKKTKPKPPPPKAPEPTETPEPEPEHQYEEQQQYDEQQAYDPQQQQQYEQYEQQQEQQQQQQQQQRQEEQEEKMQHEEEEQVELD